MKQQTNAQRRSTLTLLPQEVAFSQNSMYTPQPLLQQQAKRSLALQGKGLTINDGTQELCLVGPLEPSAPRTLDDILLTHGLAIAVLHQRQHKPGTIDAVTMRSDNKVEMTWQNATSGTSTTTVPIADFLMPFRLRRLTRSTCYKLAALPTESANEIPAIAHWLSLTPDSTIDAVYENRYKPAHLVVTKGLMFYCTCADYDAQLKVFSQQPHLWEVLEQQPICKHVLCKQRG
ncbi:MAG: hypothetical protein RBJ76_06085 [Stenomitos frigidus ULC029]